MNKQSYIDLVKYTCDEIVKSKGWFTHVSEDNVRIVLLAQEIIDKAQRRIRRIK